MDTPEPSQPPGPDGPRGPVPGNGPKGDPFAVVGVGASAGGLEALSELLTALPEKTGMAVVVVQHLDPQHETLLSTLLSRVTRLPVVEVTDGLAVEPDHVYVIPRNTSMTIAGGLLKLTPRGESRGPHLPIDLFLKSLAEDRQSAAVGVILSGTGTDGTLGMEEVKAAGGITIAQDEASAKYPGMPRSASGSGCVDLVLPPAQIALELARISRHPYVAEGADGVAAAAVDGGGDEPAFGKILGLLRSTFGVDFGGYRETTVRRRILRRMVLHTKGNLDEYLRHLETDRGEVEALYQDILINVTSFFREPETFEALKEVVFPGILKSKNATTPIRIWVPGCSTGQEAYSLVIALLEFLDGQPVRPPIQVFATDLSETVSLARAGGRLPREHRGRGLARAAPPLLRQGAGVLPDRQVDPRRLRLRPPERDVRPPFSHVDLVSCRNLLIYLTPALQKRVIPTFHYALNPGGFLLLGSAETVGTFDNLFAAADPKHRVYARKATGHATHPAFLPAEAATGGSADVKPLAPADAPADWQRTADALVIREYVPPGVLVNDDFDVLQFRGRTADYLESPQGEPTRDVLKMARDGLFVELRDALIECRRGNAPVRRQGVRLRGEGAVRETDLRVLPVKPTGSDVRCFLVLFEKPGPVTAGPAPPPTAAPAPDAGEVDRLRRELDGTRDYVQSVLEQQNAANEELRSANEEILSSNEELRSTNEELETAKEELQSVNEELTTVNEQLQNRNAELTRLGDDMTNLLGSANVPMIHVGVDLRVRKFTPAAGKVLKLVPGDVGSPVGEIESVINVPDLEELITEVIETVQPVEREVRGRDGHAYLLGVRPYRTADNRIDGAVVVLTDVDEADRARVQLRKAGEFARSIVDTVRDPLLILDSDLLVKSANASFYRTFLVNPADTEGRCLFELGDGQWDIPALRKLLERILPDNRTIEEYEIGHDFPGIGSWVMLLNARPVVPREGTSPLILLASRT